MDKKILSTAIAGVLAGSMAFAANADVTLYGKVIMSIDSVDEDGGSDDITMESRNGFGAIGVKGSEDLGNGLQAIFQLEYGTNPADAAGTLTGRDQWLGMKGGFGTIRAGSISTSYKESGAKLDPFWRTSLDTRDVGQVSQLHSSNGHNGQGRATNTLRYDSMDLNGAKIVAHYSFDDVKTDVEDNDAYGIGLHYANGPILATVDYITNDNGGDDDAWKLGGKYTMGDFAVFGHYERGGLLFAALNAGEAGNGADGATIWHLGGSFTMGNAMLYAAYAQGDIDEGLADDEYESWTLAGNYSFSKRTSMYAGFVQVDQDTVGEIDKFTIGMVHNF